MGMWIGRNRKARVTYGFDEIALVPGRVTINPNEVDIRFRLPRKETDPLELKIPILASAMDGVVDVRFAIAMNKLGGLAVLNLEGVQTRYKNPQEVLEKIVEAERLACAKLRMPVYWRPSVPFLSVPLNLAESRRMLALMFSWCKAQFRQSGIFLRSIGRSTWKSFAVKCVSR